MKSVKMAAAARRASTRRHPHLGVLFQRARRVIDAEILDELARAGFTDLRDVHAAVFSFLPVDGARLTELARRARITKQAMGEVVRELEALGYVGRQTDPHDARAKTITFTAKGIRADQVGILAARNTERRWARRIGAARMNDLRDTLEQLVQEDAR